MAPDECKAGHRERQRARLRQAGPEALSDQDLLEMLLFYALPRVDTKPLACALLSQFGDLSGVLKAPAAELVKVCGVRERTAQYFLLLRELFGRAGLNTAHADFFDEVYCKQYLTDLFASCERECVYALCLTDTGSLLECRLIHRGEINSAFFSMRAVTEAAFENECRNVTLAHNHPGGSIYPSSEDIYTTRRLMEMLAANDIILREHYIVTQSGCTPILKNLS